MTEALDHGPPARRRLRPAVLIVCAIQTVVWALEMNTQVRLWNSPSADGLQIIGGVARTAAFLPFTLPALLLALAGRGLIAAAILAGIATVLFLIPDLALTLGFGVLALLPLRGG
jgi:hypothetical protein